MVNLLREIYQLCMIWLYIRQNINILIIWMNVLFGNTLNDFCLDTFCFCFFNWGSSFWLTLSWGWSSEFLSIIIIILVSWRAVLDLEVPYWLFFDAKLRNLIFQFCFPFSIFTLCVAWNLFQFRVPRRFLEKIFYFLLDFW